jgi:hypothetical protein
MRKRRTTTHPSESGRVGERFSDWVESLPYVVRRSHGLSRTVSMFVVDCPPLGRRMTWLIVDQSRSAPTPTRISALLPRPIAKAAEKLRLGVCTAPALADHVLFSLDPLASRRDVESLVLAAYGAAMS